MRRREAPAQSEARRLAKDHHLLNTVYPLRPDFLVHLQVPTDMTRREADRLCMMILTLAHTDTEAGAER